MLPVALIDFVNPQYVYPAVAAVIVALVGFTSAPGSRQRAKHEAELLTTLQAAATTPEAEAIAREVATVLRNRVHGWWLFSVYKWLIVLVAAGIAALVTVSYVVVRYAKPADFAPGFIAALVPALIGVVLSVRATWRRLKDPAPDLGLGHLRVRQTAEFADEPAAGRFIEDASGTFDIPDHPQEVAGRWQVFIRTNDAGTSALLEQAVRKHGGKIVLQVQQVF